MGKYTQLNHRDTIKNRYHSLFALTACYCFSHKGYLDNRADIQKTNSYQRLTQYNREYLRGMEEMFFHELYRNHLVFCYDYNGRRYAIDTPEYKALSPRDVADNATWHGHCWRKDITKEFSGSRQ